MGQEPRFMAQLRPRQSMERVRRRPRRASTFPARRLRLRPRCRRPSHLCASGPGVVASPPGQVPSYRSTALRILSLQALLCLAALRRRHFHGCSPAPTRERPLFRYRRAGGAVSRVVEVPDQGSGAVRQIDLPD